MRGEGPDTSALVVIPTSAAARRPAGGRA